ncbi:hypothetical protein [Paenibacillus crassostreae]|uniref:Uncharacterized protein n=1 Tax=Paenibacillus crassostreae TaxID=1763538 RepID=A0A167C4V5_9BACL|nr:hypothetical protein [Paenibacillus crassostreae]AOZ91642.1 hypothetical protein LPB68_05020 [Paenibacillus crassostreae]OAB72784.1 hypothetical protein PNBC_15230 [Paenibacillus crassostreae]
MSVEIVLKYKETTYRFVDESEYGPEEITGETAEFYWEDGNGSCDCNRANGIRKYCDPTFPEMNCGGDEIDLISVTVM